MKHLALQLEMGPVSSLQQEVNRYLLNFLQPCDDAANGLAHAKGDT